MARTLGGNYTGRAAVIDRHERLAAIVEANRRDDEHRKRLFWRRWWRWLNELKRLDPGWEAWYDARPEQSVQEMLPLIQERVRIMRSR